MTATPANPLPERALDGVALDGLSPERQEELALVLDGYLAELERGLPPDPEKIVAAHPHLAEPIRAYLRSLDFLHGAAAGVAPRPAPAAEIADKRLGDFQLVREIGRGGMGVVYEARQLSLDRRVALKVLPFAAVLDTRQIARFGNEARAAAQLHHPHIVPVFAVGSERGVHYYAMQFIDGQPLDRAVAELRFAAGLRRTSGRGESPLVPTTDPPPVDRFASTAPRADLEPPEPSNSPAAPSAPASTLASAPQRLSTAQSIRSRSHFRSVAEIGIQVAEALQHAHDIGIIHRDIKPSNLLLDQAGKVWVTDFGLARVRSDASMTMTGDVMGTVRYMSPEQAAGQPVDERTDIYSLGITLYELLTLRHAFDAPDRQQFLRQIACDEPRAPRRWNPSLPVDLETIVLKSIAKSRDQRYATAAEFAADLRAFLDDKTIQARRPTLVDRAGKWAVRHRTLVAAALLLLVLAVGGLTVSTVLIARAQNETRRALASSQENFRRAERNFERAELHFRQARDAVERSSQHAAELAAIQGTEDVRRQMLQDALGYYDQFIRQVADDPSLPEDTSLHADLARSHFRTAALTEQLGDRERALASYAEAAARYERLVNSFAAQPKALRSHLAPRDVPVSNNDGRGSSRGARWLPDLSSYERHLALCHNNRALLLGQLGRTDEAEQAFRAAIALQRALLERDSEADDVPSDLALSCANLGLLYNQTGRPDEAEKAMQEGVAVLRTLVKKSPNDPTLRASLAAALNNLSYQFRDRDPESAEKLCREALSLLRQVVAEMPNEARHLGDLALSWNNFGALRNRAGRRDEARRAYQQAAELQLQLCRKAPSVVKHHADLAVTYNNLGWVANEASDLEAAEEAYQSARTILEDLVRDYPAVLNYHSSLGGVFHNLGLLYERSEHREQAETAFRLAIRHQQFAWEHAPRITHYRDYLDRHWQHLGRLHRRAERWDDCVASAVARRPLWRGEGHGDKLLEIARDVAAVLAKLPTESDAEVDERRAKFVVAAISCLEEARAAGIEEEKIRLDRELHALREHPKFQEWLERI